MVSRDGAFGVLMAAAVGTLFLVPAHGSAQDPQMVEVDGHQMHVLTIGLENAESGSPVVVFEAGFGGGLGTWGSVVHDVADFAPVVAYDRAGLRESEPDGQLPTSPHVAENLHALLEQVGAEPPYVLVGHSLGGAHIRMFTGMYPEDVAGLVYVDPTMITTEEDQRALEEAMGISREDAQRVRQRNRERAPPSGELAVILEPVDTRFAEFHALPPVPDIPVRVLMSGLFNARAVTATPSSGIQLNCEPRECYSRLQRVKTEIMSRLVQGVTNGTVTVAENSGHFIQRDEPGLVVQAIREVVEARVR